MIAVAVASAIVLLLALRQQLYLVLASTAVLLYLAFGGGRPADVIQDLFSSVDQDILLSVPLFVLAGSIMSHGSIARRLIRLAVAVTAPVPGGLAVAAVLSCAMFAAISGSSTVTLLAVGPVLYPALQKNGYTKSFSLGLLAASGTLGIIIPPSIPLILYGISTHTSIIDLFLAGIGPGLLLAALIMAYAMIRNSASAQGRWEVAEIAAASRSAVFSLAMPVIILGGIYSGHFTATESAAISVVYAIAIELFVHRDIAFGELRNALTQTVILAGTLIPLLGLALSVNVFMTMERVPQTLVELIGGYIDSRFTFIVAATLMLLLVGCFMEITPAVLIMAPLLTPMAVSYGVDPVHFGIMMIVNLEIGYLTPPMGLNLFVAMTAFDETFAVVARAAVPFILVLLAGLALVSLWPEVSLFLIR